MCLCACVCATVFVCAELPYPTVFCMQLVLLAAQRDATDLDLDVVIRALCALPDIPPHVLAHLRDVEVFRVQLRS